jgi:hypothetical protein
VVENMDEAQLKSAVKNDSNPIVYFEKERDFFRRMNCPSSVN